MATSKAFLLIFLLATHFTYGREIKYDCDSSLYKTPDRVQRLYNEKKYLAGAEAAVSFWDKCSKCHIKNEIVYITVYNTTCCWALSNKIDSAFRLLNEVIDDDLFLPLFLEMQNDADLTRLHSDVRWEKLIDKGNSHLKIFSKNIDSPLVRQLQMIRYNDQKYRAEVAKLNSKKEDSIKIKSVWKAAELQDSIDMVKISEIIKKHGWPGPKLVGFEGNKTVFLVVQHASLKEQLYFLPLMRNAVKKGLASPGDLAFLEDRILLREHKKQIYGTQLNQNFTKAFPIRDSATVDCRRFKVGLVSLDRYINNW